MILNSPTISGSLTVTGNSTFAGTMTAQTLVVQTITSSISVITGSTKFGTLSANTHTFTGSMFVTGAFYVTTGSIGIGTSSPQLNLHILTGGTAFSSTTTYSSSTSRGILLEQQNGTSNNGNAIWFNNSGLYSAISSTRENSGDWGTNIIFYTHPTAISNQYDVTERMRITSAGNVGIGTTNISTEANLYLGAQGTGEGGQLVLQKGTSQVSASHIDNYQNLFRIMSGTDTTSSTVRMSVDMTSGATTINGSLATTSFIENRTSFTLFSASDTTIALLYSGIVIIRDANNGGTCVVMYENGSTPTIISQQGVTVFTTASPSASQIQLKNRTGDSGIAARAGTSLNGVGIIVCNLRIQGI